MRGVNWLAKYWMWWWNMDTTTYANAQMVCWHKSFYQTVDRLWTFRSHFGALVWLFKIVWDRIKRVQVKKNIHNVSIGNKWISRLPSVGSSWKGLILYLPVCSLRTFVEIWSCKAAHYNFKSARVETFMTTDVEVTFSLGTPNRDYVICARPQISNYNTVSDVVEL